MKKLMIAAAIVCAAAVSQAAKANWQAGDIYTFEGAAATSENFAQDYLVYFVDSYTTAGGDVKGYSYAKAQADIAKGDLSFLKTYGHAGEIYDGYVDPTDVDGYANNQAIDGYVVILNNSDFDKADYVYLSSEMSKSTGGEGQPAAFTFNTSSSATGANWTQVAPEPTSGLLLLIGVAGLALRRRRA